MKIFDLIVIGSGGGTKIGTPAAKLGKKVAVIEERRFGGTCLNRGCIPSKMLIHPANIICHALEAEKLHVHFKKPEVGFSTLVEELNNTIDEESESIPKNYDNIPTLEYFIGRARFKDDNTVVVNNEELQADTIIVATGAKPRIPEIPGLKDTPFMTSEEALKNTTLPESLVVIGGGYIACELGHAYASFGSKTTFLVRSKLLSAEDDEVREEFTKAFSEKHQILLNTNTTKVEYENNTFRTHYIQDGEEKVIESEALIVAAGVVPNSSDMGLENTSIEVDSLGFIKVNDHLQASKNVYALGDVVGTFLFRHSVNFEGEYLFNELFGEQQGKPIKYPPMPHAVFTHPEIAGVGATEQDLQKQGVAYVVGKNAYKSSAMGMARKPQHGFVKLLFDKETRVLLGAHIIGDEASVMIHQAIHAITYKATLDDLLGIIYIHPALPEIFRNACRKAKAEFDKGQ